MPELTTPVIVGDGIRLRAFAPADTGAVIAAGRDPLIPMTTTVQPNSDHAAALLFIDRQHDRARTGEGFSFAIADAESDEAIGQMGVWLIEPRHGRIRLGYWVVPEWRGRHVASRALTLATDFALALADVVRAELFIEPWNTGSRRTAINAGYRCEGLQRRAQRVNGVSRDMFVYGRQRADRPDGTDDSADLVVGDATDSDVAELLVLQRCCWVQEAIVNDTLDIPPLHETHDDVRAWVREWTTLTVRDDHRLVGAVRARLVGRTWEIGRLMVAPDHAGRGLGRRLLDQAERLAPPAATTFELFTGAKSARNIGIYKGRGTASSNHRPCPPNTSPARSFSARRSTCDHRQPKRAASCCSVLVMPSPFFLS